LTRLLNIKIVITMVKKQNTKTAAVFQKVYFRLKVKQKVHENLHKKFNHQLVIQHQS
jgi:hypothetical protein